MFHHTIRPVSIKLSRLIGHKNNIFKHKTYCISYDPISPRFTFFIPHSNKSSRSHVKGSNENVRHGRDNTKFLKKIDEKKRIKANAKTYDIWANITLEELANVINIPVDDLLEIVLSSEECDISDISSPIAPTSSILKDIKKVLKCNFKVIRKELTPLKSATEKLREYNLSPPLNSEMLESRSPVVVIMGHVDHGKTTLLDFLRKSRVVDSEFGGITQHISVFSVEVVGRGDGGSPPLITFIDTPGHALFSEMRARGASITDIAVLVVDASEGVLPQTTECIELIRQSGCYMVVAVNKIDKQNANVEGVLKQLKEEENIHLQHFGGDVPHVPISALHGTNVDQLIQCISLQADVLNLTGECGETVEGHVIESEMSVGTGISATVLVTRGELKIGNFLVAGKAFAKVKRLVGDCGDYVKNGHGVSLSSAAKVYGWKSIPDPGVKVYRVSNEHTAKEIASLHGQIDDEVRNERNQLLIDEKRRVNRESYKAVHRERLESGRNRLKFALLNHHRSRAKDRELSGEGRVSKLPYIVKADVNGSLDAISTCLSTYNEQRHLLGEECVRLDSVAMNVGPVNSNDLKLANIFDAPIYAFNVAVDQKIYKEASELGVSVKNFNVIYKLIDDFKQRIGEALPQRRNDIIVGRASILQVFEVTTRGKTKVPVFGAKLTEGVLQRNTENMRIVRRRCATGNGEGDDCVTTIFDGNISEIRHLKEVVSAIENVGQEFGLKVEELSDTCGKFNLSEVKPDDVIETYIINYEIVETQWSP